MVRLFGRRLKFQVIIGKQMMPPADQKPNFAPSYDLHVLPSQIRGTSNFSGMDFWSLKGFDLKGVIGVLYDVSRIRIVLPPSVNDGRRYDCSLVLPEPEDGDRMRERFRQGIQDHFHVSGRREDRLLDVYVVTTTLNRNPPVVLATPLESRESLSRSGHISFEVLKDADHPGGVSGAHRTFSVGDIRSMSVEGSADDFCHHLERSLDRPVVNETGLLGEFAFHLGPSATEGTDFLDLLRDELGLVIAPAQRSVGTLVFDLR
jgi:uncharacterized protein (TIGR03435 family)